MQSVRRVCEREIHVHPGVCPSGAGVRAGALGTISAPRAGCSEAGRGTRVGVTFPYISCSSALPLWGPWD